MSTLALRYDPAQYAADLAAGVDDELETEVLVALLSEARVADSEVPHGKLNRGFWADAIDPTGEQTGSRLWLLEDAVATADNARRAETYAREALAFLVNSRRARAVTATGSIEGEALFVTPVITRRNGTERSFGKFRVNHAV